ncbi:hypothetical protein D3C80_1128210 [compost metagenome]
MDQPGVVLAVDVLHLRVVITDRQARVDRVGATGQVQMIALDPGVAHFVVARGIAQVLFFQAAEVQGQAVDVLGGQQAAAVGRRQQAHVVDRRHRQHRLQGAELERGLADPQLGGQAQFTVVVHRFLGGAEGQQAGAATVAAGVELDPQFTQGIEAEAYGAFGKARLHFQDKTLGPFPRLALRRAALAKVAAEVEVACLKAGLAVLDELGLGDVGGECGAQAGTHRQRTGQKHGATFFCCCVWRVPGVSAYIVNILSLFLNRPLVGAIGPEHKIIKILILGQRPRPHAAQHAVTAYQPVHQCRAQVQQHGGEQHIGQPAVGLAQQGIQRQVVGQQCREL